MMRSWAVAAIALLLGLAGCSRGRLLRADEERNEGRQLYVRTCASCHGTDGRGFGPVAPALRVPPPDLTTLAARSDGVFPRAYVIEVIAGERELPSHGTRDMPVWSQRFGPGPGRVASGHARRRLELLADHLASLQQ
jgi:mono/diheme cytochrome c family protein